MSRSLSPLCRSFSTSLSVAAGRAKPGAPSEELRAQREKASRRPILPDDVIQYQTFEFDDTTTMGYLRMLKMKEAQTLLEKVTDNHADLKRHRRQFVPPTSPIRITQTIDLTYPDLPLNHRRSLIVPVSALPLSSPESIHRIKLIAGPRWSPERPGKQGYEIVDRKKSYNAGPADVGTEGWIKISEDRFGDGRMNRKSVSDMLDRLISAANDNNSPLSSDIPLDTRHLVARSRRRRKGDVMTNAKALALEERPGKVGGVEGYPLEWLSPEVQERIAEKRASISE